jgi:hypothetical protein
MSALSDQHHLPTITKSRDVIDGRYELIKMIGDGLQSKVYLSQCVHLHADCPISDDKVSEMSVDRFAIKVFEKEELKDLGL